MSGLKWDVKYWIFRSQMELGFEGLDSTPQTKHGQVLQSPPPPPPLGYIYITLCLKGKTHKTIWQHN